MRMQTNMEPICGLLVSTRSNKLTDYGTKEPLVDDNGNFTYRVRAQVADGSYASVIEVRIKSKEDPAANFKLLDRVLFDGCVLTFGKVEKPFWNISAKSMRKA